MTIEEIKAKICKIAAGHGYRYIKAEPYCINFDKIDRDGIRIVINVYWNGKINYSTNPLFTVQTAMKHPKNGRTQLNRRGVDFELLVTLFDHPRTHTGRGYYKIPKNHRR